MKQRKRTSRRDFLKTAAVTGAGLGLAGSLAGGAARATDPAAADGGEAQPAEKVPRQELGATGASDPDPAPGLRPAVRRQVRQDPAPRLQGGRRLPGHRADVRRRLVAQDHRSVRQAGRRPQEALDHLQGSGQERHRARASPATWTPVWSSWRPTTSTCTSCTPWTTRRYLEPEYIKMGEALRKSGKTRFFGFSCHGGRGRRADGEGRRGGRDRRDHVPLQLLPLRRPGAEPGDRQVQEGRHRPDRHEDPGLGAGRPGPGA